MPFSASAAPNGSRSGSGGAVRGIRFVNSNTGSGKVGSLQQQHQTEKQHQQQLTFNSDILSSRLDRLGLTVEDAAAIAKAYRLTAVPASRLPSFYSRRHCSCKSAKCTEDDSSSSSSKAGLSSVGAGVVKRRPLVQARICDMFPSKKRIRLQALPQQQQQLASLAKKKSTN